MSKSIAKIEQQSWGRTGKDLKSIIEVTIMLTCTPFVVLYYFISCHAYDCALSSPATEFYHGRLGLWEFLSKIPLPTSEAIQLYAAWHIFQIVLYLYLPGPRANGQETPAGHTLRYNVNGLRAFIVSHIVVFALVYFGYIRQTIVYDYWGELLILSNLLGIVTAVFAYVKANFFPTHPDDVRWCGTSVYDFFMGAEMNPRIGNFDFKLYFNGRPGIGGWNLFNLSFAAHQYKTFGSVTNSMWLVIFLQFLYIIDFFWNEDWYLKTIDIAHDHFGWYLAWGDSVWLPYMYTLQGFYLATHHEELSLPYFLFVFALSMTGYYIFRDSNDQRHKFRKAVKPENHIVWGQKAKFLKVSFVTSDGAVRSSNLLTSGYWGLSRHFNYFGDLIFSLSTCLACGTKHALPYFYIFNMTVLLLWRIERDNSRCKQKYKERWAEYCSIVPYKLIPYVY